MNNCKILIFCLSLGLACPAAANSLEDSLCQTTSAPIEKMATSEKLCRSFALGVSQVPQAATEELYALLTPENLAAMTSLTGAWLGSQSIPGVGQAVDAALVAIGVVLLAVQAADLSHALWDYARLATHARTRDDLSAAGARLARAIALVGVNVVTIILTHKAATRLKRRPPTGPPLKLATPPGTPEAPPPPRTTEAPARAPAVRASKIPNLKTFADWVATAKTRLVSSREPAFRYQVAKAGEKEFLLQGGGEQVWADGVRHSDARILDTKFVQSPEISPYIDGSKCIDVVRASAREQEVEQFRRYAAVLHDPQTPAIGLEIITNDARAVPYFESLMKLFNIPGRVVVDP